MFDWAALDEEYGKISIGPGDESTDEGDGDAPFESEHDEHHLDEAYGFMGFAWHKLSPFWSMRKIQNSM